LSRDNTHPDLFSLNVISTLFIVTTKFPTILFIKEICCEQTQDILVYISTVRFVFWRKRF